MPDDMGSGFPEGTENNGPTSWHKVCVFNAKVKIAPILKEEMIMKDQDRIYPVILCGGSGTRLWPLSREALPKQFIALSGDDTMYQSTLCMVKNPDLYQRPTIVTCERFHGLSTDQALGVGMTPHTVILEPHKRNTAPAIALAALAIAETDPDACMVVMPSDHVFGETQQFHEAVEAAQKMAKQGLLVTFGMKADKPETGYGYIRQGDQLEQENCFRVAGFIEKPEKKAAEFMLAEGMFHWNSGIFVFTARRYLEELFAHRATILTSCMKAMDVSSRDGNVITPDADIFAHADDLSIDYAVMEKTRSAAVVVADFGWNDVGSWSAVAQLQAADQDGNTVSGDTVIEDCTGTYIRGEDRLIAAIGLEDFLIIDTPDALLVAPKARAQDVKAIVAHLRSASRREIEMPAEFYKPSIAREAAE